MPPKSNLSDLSSDSPPLPTGTSIPIHEALRLARRSGAIPYPSPSSSKPSSSTFRERKKTLVDGIPKVEGVTVEEVDLRDYEGELGEEVGDDDHDQGEEEDGEDDYGEQDQDAAADNIPMQRRPRNKESSLRPPPITENQLDLGDELFFDSLYVIPLVSLYLLLDILAHKQYNRHPEVSEYVGRLIQAIPTISFFVFLANRHPSHPVTNPLLMLASVFAGGRLVWLVNKESYSVVMKQAPPVGTLWIFTVVQLPLGRCMLALAIMFGWCWWKGMKFRP